MFMILSTMCKAGNSVDYKQHIHKTLRLCPVIWVCMDIATWCCRTPVAYLEHFVHLKVVWLYMDTLKPSKNWPTFRRQNSAIHFLQPRRLLTKSLIQIMAWRRKAMSHYLSHRLLSLLTHTYVSRITIASCRSSDTSDPRTAQTAKLLIIIIT